MDFIRKVGYLRFGVSLALVGAAAYVAPSIWATDRTLFGVGMDGNIVSASLKAIVSGLQRAGLATEQEESTWQTN